MSKHKFKLGPLTIDAQAYGSQGNAILGIRDSGKSYTATEIAEKLFDAGVPFITFDPTGVWPWLQVPGKGRGYPIVVAGGKRGNLPLTVSGAVEIVRAAMKNGVSLVIDLTDPNLSKADWKRIVKSCVRVLLQENAQHGLRHIFIEEAAEFVPQRVLDGDVYAEVEKLARIGGNSRLGYTLINQRSQEVNKAVLELCENLFLHRQKGANAITSLDHWLDVAGVAQEEIVKSLPRLPTGHCWAWMGGDDKPVLIEVPPKNSFHPDRRTMHGAKGARSKKAVDVGSFINDMKAALVTIEAEDAANNPVKLRAEIAALKAEKVKLEKAVADAAGKKPVADKDAIDAAEKRGYDAATRDALKAAKKLIEEAVASIEKDINPLAEAIREATHTFRLATAERLKTLVRERQAIELIYAPMPAAKVLPRPVPSVLPQMASRAKAGTPSAVSRQAPADGTFTRPQMKVLQSLAMWRALGHAQPTREMVAAVAGYSPSSGGYNNLLGGIKSAGAIDYPQPGQVMLLAEGIGVMTREEGAAMLWDNLSNPQRKIVSALIGQGERTREEVGADTGYSPSSGGYNNLLGSLRTLALLDYPRPGVLAMVGWADELLSGMRAAA
jgi:hypothetical protein